jgi:sugar phosphate isomerase/epimerase
LIESGHLVVAQTHDERAGGLSQLRRAGVSQSTTAPWTLEEDVAAYAGGGWRAIGVWLHKLERPTMSEFWFPEKTVQPAAIDQAANTIRFAGLSVSHVVLAGRFVDPDARTRKKRLDHAVFAVEAGRRLAARCLVVVPGRLNGLRRPDAVEMTASALAQLLERSEGMDVPVAIEPVKELDFITTLDDALDLIEMVDHPRLGVLIDLFQLWRDPRIEDTIARATGRILAVHVADAHPERHAIRLPPGDGEIPLVSLVRRIEAGGYQGTYDVELLSFDAHPSEAGRLLQRCRIGMEELLAAAGAAS